MVTAKQAAEWMKEHPTANMKQATLALPGIRETTFYKARKMAKLQVVPPVKEAEAAPEEQKKETKTSRMMAWIKANPHGLASDGAKTVGCTQQLYYACKRVLAGNPYKTSAQRKKEKTQAIVVREPKVMSSRREHFPTPGERITNLILQLGMEVLASELSHIRRQVEER